MWPTCAALLARAAGWLAPGGRLMVVDVPETQPLSMALKVRQYDDHGMPAKGKGPEAVDHDCDGLEYVIWRIVASDPDFKDIWRTGLHSRAPD